MLTFCYILTVRFLNVKAKIDTCMNKDCSDTVEVLHYNNTQNVVTQTENYTPQTYSRQPATQSHITAQQNKRHLSKIMCSEHTETRTHLLCSHVNFYIIKFFSLKKIIVFNLVLHPNMKFLSVELKVNTC